MYIYFILMYVLFGVTMERCIAYDHCCLDCTIWVSQVTLNSAELKF